jgi:hypothetical protein
MELIGKRASLLASFAGTLGRRGRNTRVVRLSSSSVELKDPLARAGSPYRSARPSGRIVGFSFIVLLRPRMDPGLRPPTGVASSDTVVLHQACASRRAKGG